MCQRPIFDPDTFVKLDYAITKLLAKIVEKDNFVKTGGYV